MRINCGMLSECHVINYLIERSQSKSNISLFKQDFSSYCSYLYWRACMHRLLKYLLLLLLVPYNSLDCPLQPINYKVSSLSLTGPLRSFWVRFSLWGREQELLRIIQVPQLPCETVPESRSCSLELAGISLTSKNELLIRRGQ